MSLQHPQIQAFIAIARNGTVHGAAKELHLTQTAVTQRLKNLESNLKKSLFSRTRRGMLLTPEGEALLHYCNAALDLELETLQKIQGAGFSADVILSIAGPSTIMHSRVIPSCYPILEKYPHLLFDFQFGDSTEPVENLSAGKCQIAILDLPQLHADLSYKRLRPEEYVLVCKPEWQDRDIKDIIANEPIIDFDKSDQMTYNYLQQFNLIEYVKPQRHFANHSESLAALISAGFGYGVLAKEFAQTYVQTKRLVILNPENIYNHAIYLAWNARTQPADYFAAIIDSIK